MISDVSRNTLKLNRGETMKVTGYGVVLALKNLGIWLGQFTLAGIRVDSQAFMYSLLIYCLVSVPTDILLLNHATSKAKET